MPPRRTPAAKRGKATANKDDEGTPSSLSTTTSLTNSSESDQTPTTTTTTRLATRGGGGGGKQKQQEEPAKPTTSKPASITNNTRRGKAASKHTMDDEESDQNKKEAAVAKGKGKGGKGVQDDKDDGDDGDDGTNNGPPRNSTHRNSTQPSASATIICNDQEFLDMDEKLNVLKARHQQALEAFTNNRNEIQAAIDQISTDPAFTGDDLGVAGSTTISSQFQRPQHNDDGKLLVQEAWASTIQLASVTAAAAVPTAGNVHEQQQQYQSMLLDVVSNLKMFPLSAAEQSCAQILNTCSDIRNQNSHNPQLVNQQLLMVKQIVSGVVESLTKQSQSTIIPFSSFSVQMSAECNLSKDAYSNLLERCNELMM